MPATFEGFGLKLLYPDNWTLAARVEDEGDQGLTFDLPGGGFLSLETLPITREDDVVIEEIDQAIRDNYEDVERESIDWPAGDAAGHDDASEHGESSERGESSPRAVEWRFYCLDLIVISRVVLMDAPPSTREQMPIAGRLLMQFQAELRDFEAGERVASAILKQIRDHR